MSAFRAPSVPLLMCTRTRTLALPASFGLTGLLLRWRDCGQSVFRRGSGKMIEPEAALATSRSGWNKVARLFHGGTALAEYGPLAPIEDTLTLLHEVPGSRVLELGCGSGDSLRYLAERGAQELWGIDLSPVQTGVAE